MADETTPQQPADGQQTPPATPAQQATIPAQTVTFTPEQQALIDKQMADTRRVTERDLRNSQELKTLREKAAKADQLEEATKSDLDKLTDRAVKAETLAQTAQQTARNALIRAAFQMEAVKANLPVDRIDAAFRLTDLDEVEVDEGLKVHGAGRALKAMLDANPFFLGGEPGERAPKPAANINSGGAPTRPASRADVVQSTRDQLAASGKYGF